MVTLLGLGDSTVYLPTGQTDAVNRLASVRGPAPTTWLVRVNDEVASDGQKLTVLYFRAPVESPAVWGALSGAALVGGLVGLLIGKRIR